MHITTYLLQGGRLKWLGVKSYLFRKQTARKDESSQPPKLEAEHVSLHSRYAQDCYGGNVEKRLCSPVCVCVCVRDEYFIRSCQRRTCKLQTVLQPSVERLEIRRISATKHEQVRTRSMKKRFQSPWRDEDSLSLKCVHTLSDQAPNSSDHMLRWTS